MKKLLLSLFIVCLGIASLSAQNNYWQQAVNYDINVRLDDVKNELSGYIEIEYTNNSPDVLNFIWFHLWPNAYRDENTAFSQQQLANKNTRFYYAPASERGFMDEIAFAAEGKPLKWEYDGDTMDICKVYLNKPLNTGDKIKITTPFHVKIPATFSRMGHEGQSYQISQWYPKPAVYDKKGWHQIPYLDQGEFYSEYGSFDVHITLPKNYVVGATGELQDWDEKQFLNAQADETANRIEARKKNNFAKDSSLIIKTMVAFPKSDSAIKTIEYKADHVHDFAWFADKRFNVLKGEVELPVSHRKVTTWALFTNKQYDFWKDAIPYINETIYNYSDMIGEYPFNNCTAVEGALSAGGGMEYPNITIIGNVGSAMSLEEVIVHEVGHNWFYSQLGTNERMYPWMDEGINSYYEYRVMSMLHPDSKLMGDFAKKKIAHFFDLDEWKRPYLNELTYLATASTNNDQPLGSRAQVFTQVNYGADVYMKTALVMEYLARYLGYEQFDHIMHKYYKDWEFKHPQPEDMRAEFETETEKNLDWFFDDMVNSKKKLDYKIVSVKVEKEIAEPYVAIEIKNAGEIPAPFAISAIRNDSIIQTKWFEGSYTKTKVSMPYVKCDKYRINTGFYPPEINEKNNTIRTHGMLKRWEPIRLQFASSLSNPHKSQLFFYPAVGWNNYDRWMLGMIIYNHTVPFKKFEYTLLPMYSFADRDLNGVGELSYNMYPHHAFQKVKLSLSGYMFDEENVYVRYYSALFEKNPPLTRSFLQFKKFNPAITFDFKKKTPRSSVSKTLKFRNVNIYKQVLIYGGIAGEPYIGTDHYYFNELSFNLDNNRVINPYSWSAKIQQYGSFIKATAQANYRLSYNLPRRGLDIRLFAGAITGKYDNPYGDRSFLLNLNGGSGATDYTYDEVYLGRNEQDGFLARQIVPREGGFKVPNTTHPTIGFSDQWMAAINLRTSLPFRNIPFSLYFDYGAYSEIGTGDFKTQYNGGALLSLWQNAIEVYLPFVWSKEIKDNLVKPDFNYRNQITFTIRLSQLNPFNLVESALK